MKVADGIVVRAVKKAVREVEVGRTRASAVRERADAIAKDVEHNVVAKSELGGQGKKVNAVMEITWALIGWI